MIETSRAEQASETLSRTLKQMLNNGIGINTKRTSTKIRILKNRRKVRKREGEDRKKRGAIRNITCSKT